MTTPVAPVPRLWPRYAVGPNGNSARFDCMDDIPDGWKLEKPLTAEAPPPPKNKGGRPRKVVS